jgi:fatty acid-binding protein DegV
MRYVFRLDTLEYLVKGGRVSKTAGFIGGLLEIRQLLTVKDIWISEIGCVVGSHTGPETLALFYTSQKV